ncbi:OmpW/AlkL family protein [Paenacidovorax monticola]|uniref:OmpW family protein n=1 Tax=Paenacidovorax monticola TaxID=1926868 RepID=A0A7H0HH85_9BURK|nr:OmpW family outer membrane protein [Paenacidovorax monticola]QNP59901.1 OmpW family protein [Paenacidovorax monticola]
MKKNLLALAVLCALTSGAAFAQQASAEGPWLVRVRAVNLDSADKDSTGLGLSINNKTIPEVDISYFFTPNIAAELILTYPQKHDVRSAALGGKIGTLKHLPPTLLAQYHFTNFGGFKPYVGAGVNYTRFSSVNLPLGATVDKNSWGPALQVGVDIPLTKQLSLNFDIKKVYIKTDVNVPGVTSGKFKVDPLLVGVGLGYRF